MLLYPAAGIDNAILAYTQAVKSSPDDKVQLSSWLDDLRILLNICYDCTGNLDALTEAISLYRHVVKLPPYCFPNLPSRHLSHGALLQRLSAIYWRRFL
ncbi:hypothetical protein CPB84DRAFT_1554598 [Gymnopilus junonius]|uniref:Uncharacterized protein n=1 Tax=Gymnopilus junonius TaxID=109634 RepID=A0A9P5TKH1_GYMJU|nr:hypothetical protein CPB84DRAFT_1554598 [Gymnopilus junonius]